MPGILPYPSASHHPRIHSDLNTPAKTLPRSLGRRKQSQPPVAVYRQAIARHTANDLAIAVDHHRSTRRGDIAVNIRAAVERHPTGMNIECQPRRMIRITDYAAVDAH